MSPLQTHSSKIARRDVNCSLPVQRALRHTHYVKDVSSLFSHNIQRPYVNPTFSIKSSGKPPPSRTFDMMPFLITYFQEHINNYIKWTHVSERLVGFWSFEFTILKVEKVFSICLPFRSHRNHRLVRRFDLGNRDAKYVVASLRSLLRGRLRTGSDNFLDAPKGTVCSRQTGRGRLIVQLKRHTGKEVLIGNKGPVGRCASRTLQPLSLRRGFYVTTGR